MLGMLLNDGECEGKVVGTFLSLQALNPHLLLINEILPLYVNSGKDQWNLCFGIIFLTIRKALVISRDMKWQKKRTAAEKKLEQLNALQEPECCAA